MLAVNYKRVKKAFEAKPKSIQDYFPSFPELMQHYKWDVSMSYVFTRVELAKHDVIYCGIVKLHRTDAGMTRNAIDRCYMSRDQFRGLFKTVFGKSITPALLEKLSAAEAVRDKVVHGKRWTEAEVRQALIDIFEFAEGFNEFVFGIASFRPFGDLRGFKGAAGSLSKTTTRWVLRGMGIAQSKDSDLEN